MTTIWPGQPYPLGATWDGAGVNFALFSEHANRVELCLFETPHSLREFVRIPMPERSDDVWHCYIPGLQPGQLYGYRVYGPYNPLHGQRFNPYKLLIDPYARALSREIKWHKAVFGYRVGAPRGDLTMSRSDSAPYMPRGVVVDDADFDWGGDRHPRTPLHRTVIYELHVKGFTRLHPELPEELRGSYAGLCAPPVIAYLKSLGVTAVELLPVHQRVNDQHLQQQDLSNYWGYNTLNFFSPDLRFSSTGTLGQQVNEFKAMVRAFHAAGIEVILDVVYNHTGEGSHLGPTLSLRGIDNPTYYRLVPANPHYYMDYTGCGNSLNTLHPRTLQLIMDSLRYWISEMHVDGFRFDLAATLARGADEADRLSSFFDIIHQDPVISQVKLIAEPWDVGPGGYQVGHFPVLWAEWNGKYRDTVRRYWRGDDGQTAELAYRLAGSSDLYKHNGRRPSASINFVTAHDGFTLRDLVSYNEKHNEANGEHNRDGDNNNHSWNCGVEGPSDDPLINALREQQQRNFLATLFLSQGVPMLHGGDERHCTRLGNNNSYCQDNEISWIDWRLDATGQRLLEFTRRLIALRQAHPVLHRRSFFRGRKLASELGDIEWLCPDGQEMSADDWNNPRTRCLGLLLNGQIMDEHDERGAPIRDDILLLLFNAHHESISFLLPDWPDEPQWEVLIDTAVVGDGVGNGLAADGEAYCVQGRSLVLLRQQGCQIANDAVGLGIARSRQPALKLVKFALE